SSTPATLPPRASPSGRGPAPRDRVLGERAPSRARLLVVIACALIVAVALADEASARPGGGQSYSGSGRSSSSGGGGGGEAELVYFLIRLIIAYPSVGIPVAVVVVGYFIYKSRRGGAPEAWSSPAVVPPRAGADLGQIREVDPDFSPIVFDDFVYRLYASAHEARSRPQALAGLAPYLADAAREHLVAREPRSVATQNVVIGAMRTLSVQKEI